MDSLADHYADAKESAGSGKWLKAGNHIVRIVNYIVDNAQNEKQTPYVRFTLEDRDGRQINANFWLTTPALVILASFAKACGLPEEAARQYEPAVPQSHALLMNRWVGISVVKGEKYHEVDGWWPKDKEAEQSAPQATAPQSQAQPATTGRCDDIPF